MVVFISIESFSITKHYVKYARNLNLSDLDFLRKKWISNRRAKTTYVQDPGVVVGVHKTKSTRCYTMSTKYLPTGVLNNKLNSVKTFSFLSVIVNIPFRPFSVTYQCVSDV